MKQEKKKQTYQTEGEIPMVCEICDYAWFARKQKPRQCPNCKRQIKYSNQEAQCGKPSCSPIKVKG